MLNHGGAIITIARTLRDGQPAGPSAFLVPLDAPGITRSPLQDTGWAPVGRGLLHLDQVEVPASALLGTEGAAFRSVPGGFDFTRPLLALTGRPEHQPAGDRADHRPAEAVSEVAVVGIPDPVFGERTCACVVLRPGVAGLDLDLDELTGYMQAREIAPYKLPERLEIFAELPRTAGGKLSKVTLRSEVVERMAARSGEGSWPAAGTATRKM